ncbi:molybdopterin-dependent oxidoreductase [Thermopolyspora sp. NPDC052614]|uniref:molybdopterin-containing oxidoreductase family protein n=1 Tax=Thermopolyspora sp. NPDC052614 TaxID=3155682 RepID=UPI00344995C0
MTAPVNPASVNPASVNPVDAAAPPVEVRSTCRMCHGGCGTIATVRDGVVEKVVGDPDHPVNRGKLCVKAGKASVEQIYGPERVEHPMIRAGAKGEGRWRRVSWAEAIAFIAAQLRRLRDEHGAESIVFARGVSMNNNQIVTRFANAFGTPNIASINYYCYGPRVAACSLTSSGVHSGRIWDTVAIADFFGRPGCVVEWGSQKRISNDHGSIGHTPMTDALRDDPFNIIVDPRKPSASGDGDIWLPLRPGTDAAMALGWMNVIISEELYDRDFVENWCHGFDRLAERAAWYTPERVAEITWCDPAAIRAAARVYAQVKPAAIAWGTGADHIGRNAVQSNRAIHSLMGLTGNLDVPGGNVYWPQPRLADTERWDLLPAEQAAKRLGADRFKALTQRPTVYAHPPSVFRAILTGEPYPVKGMLVLGNNPAVCYPDTASVTAALRKLDLLVVSEIFMTPTAELADVVLPAASNLERDDPRLYMHIKAPDGTLIDTATRTAVRIGERRSDWEFLIDLAHELGMAEHFPSLTAFADEALAPTGMTWEELKARDDLVVEPLRYRKYEQDGFGTPTGKFELWSTTLERWGYDPLPSHVEPARSPVSTPDLHADYPLILSTGVRQPMYWNSNGHPLPTLRRLQREPVLEIHEDTAARYGLVHKGRAWVETPAGRLRMRVRCTTTTHPQVVSIPHGWWRPEAPGPDHDIFHVCANVLIDDDLDQCDPILGSSPLKALLCRVLPAD